MFTDIAGYTALTQSNESATLELLANQRRLLRPMFTSHGGREIKTIGDAFLVEFGSALDATLCAIAIQSMMNDRRLALGEKLMLRIGIHVGDVIESEHDVLGDTVNIASRIEPLSEPGGVCVSEQVYDQVHNKIPHRLVKLGRHGLKNVAAHLDVYKVVLPWEDVVTSTEVRLDTHRVAVLPLVSMSVDPQDEYFADGLTEELIDRLSQIRELEVIARTSVMVYKKKDKKAAEIGKELRAGALVEGSVRKAGNKIRVTAQLIDANTEGHLWSSRYDKNLEDIFEVQSDIAQNVVDALKLRLVSQDRSQIQKRPTENVDAYTMYLKGRFYWNERNPEALKKAMTYFEKAIVEDPRFALAYVGLVDCYIVLIDQLVLEPEEARPKARSVLDKALKIDDRLPEALASLANMIMWEWNWLSAEAEYKHAIELNPNYATAHHWYSMLLTFTGRLKEALDEIRIAQRLDPVSPIINVNLGLVLTEAGFLEEGVEQLRKTVELEPDFGPGHAYLGETYVSISKFGEAFPQLQKAIDLVVGNPWPKSLLAYAYALSGSRAKAQEILRELEASESGRSSLAWLGTIYFALGEKEKAFSLMQRDFERRSNAILYIGSVPAYSIIRADPRFNSLLNRAIAGT
jgi:TolB-like protein/Flp pilus assembly protein TadD